MNIGNGFKNILIVLLITVVFSVVGVTAATLIKGKEVTYDNTTSKLSSTNVQDALDELSDKSKLKNRKNIVEAYTYNQTIGASNYCVTGDEETCVETTCYQNKTSGSCPAGTIIVYKVNDNKTVRFHVMYDNGDTLTMQSQRNTIYNTEWIDAADYAAENTDGTICSYTSCNDEGPITILNALESATAGWTNVNTLTYTIGTTTFKTNAFTGCSSYSECTTNTYTLSERSAKARMITLQEAAILGCTTTSKSCPVWLYNYLSTSTENGGTISDTYVGPNGNTNDGYWLITANNSHAFYVWNINFRGYTGYNDTVNGDRGARAVVEINK